VLDEKFAQEAADFCIGKCGEGYCNAMTTRRKPGDYPCIEFVCAFCTKKTDANCKWCKNGAK
jgi:hypothetical protein